MTPISSDNSDTNGNSKKFSQPNHFIKIKSTNTSDDQVATTSQGMTTFSSVFFPNRQYTQLSNLCLR